MPHLHDVPNSNDNTSAARKSPVKITESPSAVRDDTSSTTSSDFYCMLPSGLIQVTVLGNDWVIKNRKTESRKTSETNDCLFIKVDRFTAENLRAATEAHADRRLT